MSPHLALNLFIYAYKLSRLFTGSLCPASVPAEEIAESSQEQYAANSIPEDPRELDGKALEE